MSSSRLLNREAQQSEGPLIMGVLNVTPDSFSDGGRFVSADAAIAHGRTLIADGAHLIDVGGESTRPGAAAVPVDEELKRVLPVIEAIASETIVSIDTMKPEVARRAIEAGARVVNDVNGLRDAAMRRCVAETGAAVCIMHMQGEPATMQHAPTYDNVVDDVVSSLERAAAQAMRDGVHAEHIMVDPGIGFGKTLEHNLELLRNLHRVRLLGFPVVLGVSRKSFLGKLTGIEAAAERDLPSAVCAAIVASRGVVDVVRVHDVKQTRAALAIARAFRR